jgi:hypothetical protein
LRFFIILLILSGIILFFRISKHTVISVKEIGVGEIGSRVLLVKPLEYDMRCISEFIVHNFIGEIIASAVQCQCISYKYNLTCILHLRNL